MSESPGRSGPRSRGLATWVSSRWACVAGLVTLVGLVAVGTAEDRPVVSVSDDSAVHRSESAPPVARPVDFARDVLPVLSGRCFRCHGPDQDQRAAGLRLDEVESAVSVLESGRRAIAPGDLAGSELWRRVTSTDEDERMPPSEAGEALSADELQRLRTWIEEGAKFARHWSFTAPRSPHLPSDAAAIAWSHRPLDRLAYAKMAEHGLSPNPAADRATWLRRVSLDLIGLPPTWEAVDQFVHDPSPLAYEQAVERLLAAPGFGERWARIWLDLARFADSAGYAQDPPRAIWRYRDWVIKAINANLPFDQFTIEQLAGDLLPNPTNDQLLATAFHRNTMTNSEGGTDDEEFRSAAIVDRVNTTMQVWMGLTMGCAQCHSHKYDPLTQQDYFRFYAVFNNTADADRGDESPLLEELTPAQVTRRQELDQQLAAVQQELSQLESAAGGAAGSAAAQPVAGGDPNSSPSDRRTELTRRLEELKAERAKTRGIETPVMRELGAEERRVTHLQLRGSFLAKGEVVQPGVPGAFPPLPAAATPDRLNVARWLVAPDNPLTARVTINRLWEQLFGVGIVETSEDFGLQGEPPTHPELLDHLALELVDSGWDLKWILKQIVLSATYRQASFATTEKLQLDPANRWLARGPSHRLPAEMVRDQSLAVAGLLSTRMHGPSVRPLRPNLGLNSAFGGSTDWEASAGADRYRRGLYTEWRRTTPYPSLTTFDAPSREVCTIRRIRTNTPLQALVTLNDPAFVEAAQGLARQLVAATPGAADDQVRAGVRRCLLREPSAAELARLVELRTLSLDHFRADISAARQLLAADGSSSDTDACELAAMTVVANVLLNLDEFLTKK